MQAVMDVNSIPAHLRATEPAGNQMDAGAGMGGPRLSIKGKQFRYIDGDEEINNPFGQPIDVVVVATDPPRGLAKSFYEGSFVDGEDKSPVCYSADGLTPDSGSEKPQHETCQVCPHNKFGTSRKEDGSMGKGKACRDLKRVFVTQAHDVSNAVYELRVPATSLKNMQAFGKQVEKASVKLHGVICRLNFNAETSPTLTFTFGGFLGEDAFNILDGRIGSGEINDMLPSNNKSPAPAPAGVQNQLAGPQSIDPTSVPSHAQSQPVQPPSAPDVPAAAAPPQPPAVPACPMGAPMGFVMTGSVPGVTYKAFQDQGWSDKALIDNNHMQQQ
jgi:hypothetical protein